MDALKNAERACDIQAKAAFKSVQESTGIQYTEPIISDTNKILKLLKTRQNALAKMSAASMRVLPLTKVILLGQLRSLS